MKHGIEVRSGFWPLHKLKNFSLKKTSIKNSNIIFEKTLVLPSSYNLKENDVKYIYLKVSEFFDKYK